MRCFDARYMLGLGRVETFGFARMRTDIVRPVGEKFGGVGQLQSYILMSASLFLLFFARHTLLLFSRLIVILPSSTSTEFVSSI